MRVCAPSMCLRVPRVHACCKQLLVLQRPRQPLGGATSTRVHGGHRVMRLHLLSRYGGDVGYARSRLPQLQQKPELWHLERDWAIAPHSRSWCRWLRRTCQVTHGRMSCAAGRPRSRAVPAEQAPPTAPRHPALSLPCPATPTPGAVTCSLSLSYSLPGSLCRDGKRFDVTNHKSHPLFKTSA